MDAHQFHPIRSFFVQHVVNELVQSRPAVYSFCLFLLLRKLSFLEESDGVLRPCRSLWLDDKDQRHLFCHGSGRLYGYGMRPCQSRLPRGRIGIHDSFLASGSEELVGEVLAGA